MYEHIGYWEAVLLFFELLCNLSLIYLGVVFHAHIRVQDVYFWFFMYLNHNITLWKFQCRFVIDAEVSSLSAFCAMWNDEIHQLLEKGCFGDQEC